VNEVLLGRRAERRREQRVVTTDDPAALERLRDATAGPGNALDLERAVAALPPGAREVFVLHDVEGYRHEEIAELTGIAVGTCKGGGGAVRWLRQQCSPSRWASTAFYRPLPPLTARRGAGLGGRRCRPTSTGRQTSSN